MRPSLRLTAIVAMTPDRIIGLNGTLPWHLPADLAFFKKTTSGHPIVMGRKTFDSIGRPLPNRSNIILTRDPSWSAPGVSTIHSPQELFDLPNLGPLVFIIGGAEVYSAFLPYTHELIISHIHHPYQGNTTFPDFSSDFTHSEVLETFPDFVVKRWSKSPLLPSP